MNGIVDRIAGASRDGIPQPVTKLVCDTAKLIRVPSACDHVLAVCGEIRNLCTERILLYPYSHVPYAWHELNVDAAVLAAYAALYAENPCYSSCIRQLDLATIVSGGARTAAVGNLIGRLQERMHHQPRARHKRRRTTVSPPDLSFSSRAAQYIAVIEAPTIPQFLEHCPRDRSFGAPFILRGYASNWPALTPERSGGPPRWADPDYLRRRAGPGRVVPVETGARYTDADWGQTIMDWDEFLRAAGWDGAEPQSVYLAQHPLLDQFPWLADDFTVPQYVHTKPPKPEYTSTYKAPLEPIVSAWIGPGGTVSPAHTDTYYNCYVQVVGHKEVWLAPPSMREQMDAFEPGDDEHLLQRLMGNTSRIDVFSQAPSLRGAMAQSQHAILHPGDLLFFPPQWWHAMRAIDQVRLY